MATIHPTAIVDRGAELSGDVTIGAYAVVGEGVRLGRGVVLHPHAIVLGPSEIGDGCEVFPFAVLGSVAQSKKAGSTEGSLVVGAKNVFREHVTVHRGTESGLTRIGEGNLFMVGCHVAHDVVIGSSVTAANGVQLAGHVSVESYATFGGASAIAQHVAIGESAFVAGGSMCERDVPPFTIVQGDRARVRGVNRVGLERRGIPADSVRRLERAVYKLFLDRRGARDLALAELSKDDDPFVARLVARLSGI